MEIVAQAQSCLMIYARISTSSFQNQKWVVPSTRRYFIFITISANSKKKLLQSLKGAENLQENSDDEDESDEEEIPEQTIDLIEENEEQANGSELTNPETNSEVTTATPLIAESATTSGTAHMLYQPQTSQ